jgi:DNA-binding MarR family transcriptional regulator
MTLLRDVRRLFNQLRSLADALHADVGVTASMRAVLETLSLEGAASVPQMARQRAVTRQHIQALVDRLAEAGLVEARPNPAHKKSPLVALTSQGEAVFRAMREREGEFGQRISARLSGADVAAGASVIQKLSAETAAMLDEVFAERRR